VRDSCLAETKYGVTRWLQISEGGCNQVRGKQEECVFVCVVSMCVCVCVCVSV
jgi:hypothetical protein